MLRAGLMGEIAISGFSKLLERDELELELEEELEIRLLRRFGRELVELEIRLLRRFGRKLVEDPLEERSVRKIWVTPDEVLFFFCFSIKTMKERQNVIKHKFNDWNRFFIKKYMENINLFKFKGLHAANPWSFRWLVRNLLKTNTYFEVVSERITSRQSQQEVQ